MRIYVWGSGLALLAASGLLLAGVSVPAGGVADAPGGSAGAPPLVVKIHADWCGTCLRLNPTFETLERELGEQARIVVLDVTDADTVARSRARAEELGIVAFFERYKDMSGTVGVLDSSGDAVAVLKGETRTEPYAAAVAKARRARTS